MEQGKQYIAGQESIPAIPPKANGWAHIRYVIKAVAVSLVVSKQSKWSKAVYVFALADGQGAKPKSAGQVYKSNATTGSGESRTITFFSLLG